MIMHPAGQAPLPSSPARGEVPHPVWRSALPNPPAQHLPLDGGEREGVPAHSTLSLLSDGAN